jgi:hypothetical protein
MSSSGSKPRDRCRDHVAEKISTRWAETLQSASSIRWNDSVRFTGQGLEVVPGRIAALRGKERVLVPYVAKLDLEFGKGTLTLRRGVEALCTFQTGAMNFYPGLALFRHLRKQSRRAGAVG